MSNARSYTRTIICDSFGVDANNPGLVALATAHADVLPDGCLAYVIPNKRFYVLDKTLDEPLPGDLQGGMLGALGGGVWVPLLSLGSSALSVSARNLLDRVIDMEGLSSFLAMPADTDAFESVYDNSAWAVATDSGQLTYTGFSGQPFFFSLSGSFTMNAESAVQVIMALRVDGVVQDQQVTVTTPATEDFFTMSLSGIVPSIEAGHLVDVVFAGEGGGETPPELTVQNINYTLLPAF